MLRRHILLMPREKISLSAYGALGIFILLADWDKRHPNYACIPSDADIANLLGVNRSTVQRQRRALLAKGLLRERDDGRYEITHYWNHIRWKELARTENTVTQQKGAISHVASVFPQRGDAILHEKESSSPRNITLENSSTPVRIGSVVAKMQQSHFPKETVNKNKENIERKIVYSCEQCNEPVPQSVVHIAQSTTSKKICLACILRGEKAQNNSNSSSNEVL